MRFPVFSIVYLYRCTKNIYEVHVESEGIWEMRGGSMGKDAFVRLSLGVNPNATLKKTWAIVEHRAEREGEYFASPQTQ